MKKKFIKITAFLLAVLLTFIGFYNVFNFKYLDSVFKLKTFYEQEENTVDVLVLGSSHAYQGINTAVLWKEYGYSAYDLCGAAQPIWNTYYYLEEALKTQTPKVIILDTYTLHYSEEYGDTSYAIKNTYGLKWSQTKIDAIKTSFDTQESGYQYFFDVLQYHSRYSDLNKTDFYPYQANEAMYKNHKGFYCYFRSENVTDTDFSTVTYYNEMIPKVEEYYRKIIELAQSNNIPIIVTAIPFAAENYHQGFFNTAEYIAAEYGVPFYNFIAEYKDDLALDYSTDFADSQHLNYLGSTKLTRFFGDLIKENYDVPDRRGDEKYISWDKDAEVYYNQLANYEVKSINDIYEYTDIFKNERYIVIMTESVNDYESLTGFIKQIATGFFNILNISEEEYKAGGMWVYRNGKLDYYNICNGESFTKTVRLNRFDTACVSVEKRTLNESESIYTKTIKLNKSDQTKTTVGINIFVYDTFTMSAVDSICYNYQNGQITR